MTRIQLRQERVNQRVIPNRSRASGVVVFEFQNDAVASSMGDGVKRVYEEEIPVMKKLRRVGAAV